MTREQFSERCDISDSFLAAVENGQKSITSKTLFKICSNTNISADYIIFGKQYGYQMDMIMEMLGELDAPLRDSAVRSLSEYIKSVDYIKTKQQTPKLNEKRDFSLPFSFPDYDTISGVAQSDTTL